VGAEFAGGFRHRALPEVLGPRNSADEIVGAEFVVGPPFESPAARGPARRSAAGWWLNVWVEKWPTEDTPFRTQRFVLRPYRPADAPELSAYRSDATTAEFQSWSVPYPLENAERMIASVLAVGVPADGEWYNYGLADPVTDGLLGDVGIHFSSACRTAEIGYTLSPTARGRGLATEATAIVIEYLFTIAGVTRVEASVHPDNLASVRVLDRLGFVYEGTSRQSFWVGDICTDDAHYGMLLSDWHAHNHHR
jgi:RimJ/RimL family protein N-acetyltransferase